MATRTTRRRPRSRPHRTPVPARRKTTAAHTRWAPFAIGAILAPQLSNSLAFLFGELNDPPGLLATLALACVSTSVLALYFQSFKQAAWIWLGTFAIVTVSLAFYASHMRTEQESIPSPIADSQRIESSPGWPYHQSPSPAPGAAREPFAVVVKHPLLSATPYDATRCIAAHIACCFLLAVGIATILQPTFQRIQRGSKSVG